MSEDHDLRNFAIGAAFALATYERQQRKAADRAAERPDNDAREGWIALWWLIGIGQFFGLYFWIFATMADVPGPDGLTVQTNTTWMPMWVPIVLLAVCIWIAHTKRIVFKGEVARRNEAAYYAHHERLAEKHAAYEYEMRWNPPPAERPKSIRPDEVIYGRAQRALPVGPSSPYTPSTGLPRGSRPPKDWSGG